MADPISFGSVEKQHLICLSDCLVIPKVPHVHSPIRKHEMCVASVFFCAQVPAASLAVNILDLDRLSLQQGVNGEFRHGLAAASSDIAWTIGDAKNVSLAAIEPHRPVPIFSNWPHRGFFGNNFD